MLVNSGYKNGDIVAFKTTTGEEVLAKFLEQDQESFTVSKPFVLISGQNGPGLAPAMFCMDINNNSIKLNKSAVIMHTLSRKDIANEYIGATSGIIPAQNMPGV